jgi:hypothetical protein
VSLALTDPQLDAWLEAHGPITATHCPQGYGEFKTWLQDCDQAHQAMQEALKDKLSAPDALKLYFVPGLGLQDCPF